MGQAFSQHVKHALAYPRCQRPLLLSSLDNLRSEAPPFELFRTERGGEVTYHGPGQLVVYPVLDLTGHQRDLRWYMGALEEVVIRVLASLGICAQREAGLTGVWVNGAKVCAMGVRVSRWVTMHGLALNVSPDLSHFEHIVPCGIADRRVTSLEELLPPSECPNLDAVAALLLVHMSEVFQVELKLAETSADEELIAAARDLAGV